MAESKPENPYAFPVELGSSSLSSGMTLRDWFAGQALAGMCANSNNVSSLFSKMSEDAYALADALLSERGRD